MPTLALDTTTREGSVALVVGGRIVAERRGDATRSHGERLPGELTALLEPGEVALAAVDLYAVASGPGSFTGLRIGIATIQGLAFVAGRPIVAISALDALAQAAGVSLATGSIVGVWMDALRGEVFSALYRVTGAAPFTPERQAELEVAGVGAPEEAAARWAARAGGGPVVVAGDGAVRYQGVLGDAGRAGPRIIEPPILAGTIGRMAGETAARGGALAPMAVRPLYVRRPDVVIARETHRVS